MKSFNDNSNTSKTRRRKLKNMLPIITKIKKIGNSKGILIPTRILQRCSIKNYVKIVVKNKVIMVSATEINKKKTWADFNRPEKSNSDSIVNWFDDLDWTW